MPFRDDRAHLQDILESIAHIDAFLGEMAFEVYQNDLKTRSAVERQIQILTEAAKRLGEESGPKYLGQDWRSYCNMGNIIRHAYHRVNDEIVWGMVKKDLPELKASVERALQPKPPESAPR
ncbi:MAG: HepT-like ribonuclease domain-containing protein [Candidatus Korobacteraceae bacterium]